MKKIVSMMTFIALMTGCAPQNEATFHTATSALSSSSTPSRWPASAFPLQVAISSNFNSEENQAIDDMANQWSSSNNNEIIFFTTSSTTAEKNTNNVNNYRDNVLGVYKLTTWPEIFPQTALAVTQIFGTKRNLGLSSEYIEIEHADIMVNYASFAFSTDYGFGYDLQTVILHEMGHFLGLYHDDSSADESVMYPSISRFRDNRTPKEKDTENIQDKYNLHGVTASNYAFAPEEQKNSPGVPVVVVFELFPDGTEVIKINKR